MMYLFVEIGRLAGDTPDAQLLLRELGRVPVPRPFDINRLTKRQLLFDPSCCSYVSQSSRRCAGTKMLLFRQPRSVIDLQSKPQPLRKSLTLPQVFLLMWKTILLCFGGLDDVERVKASFRQYEDEKDQRGQPIITASPLDYHLFRQEICSKYPAYQPPPPFFPFEPENNTILPPLRHRQSKLDSIDSTASAGMGVHGASLMHQPVHIATPAPSPPPSPAMGGKGGKKQNYQTNQMFPFLYPPLDASSNDLGGKGSTELQDLLAGRKWRGSDVPTSILEAADLFSKRMRATRAMRQLWETRVDFMKFERGWKEDQADADSDASVDSDGLKSPQPQQPPQQQNDVDRRLSAVADFYVSCFSRRPKAVRSLTFV